MAISQGRGAPAPSQSAIPSRGPDGTEHLLAVAEHPAGMISISDDEILRILSPSATAALVLELIHAMGSSLPGRPISGGF
jgi:hypothetical protein